MRKYELFTAKEIKSAGWMLRQLEIAANGQPGNLDKMWPDVKESAWIGGTREGWERVPYWLDGFLPLAYYLDDKDAIARAERYVTAILNGQQEDGWICPNGETPRNEYDIWAVHLIAKVLVVYYDCTQDARIPEAVYRIWKNFYEALQREEIGIFKWGKFRWFEGFVAINSLKEWYPELHLIEGDFLKLDLNIIYPDGEFCVIGNYPYNISSQIFFKVLDNKDRIPICSGMIQKEVAERIASKPGKKSYGILSVLLQAYYDIEYLFTVDEHVFNPPPKVKSAVIRMTRNNRQGLGCDEALFKNIVKTAFNQRRKQMRNSLMGLVGKENPILNDPIFTKRPEQLSVEEFIALTQLIQNS